MDLFELVEICKKYSSLGWALREQLDSVIECVDEDDIDKLEQEGKLNRNSLLYIKEFLSYIIQTVDSDNDLIDNTINVKKVVEGGMNC